MRRALALLCLCACAFTLGSLAVVEAGENASCIDQRGQAVAWWFVHKEKLDDQETYKTWGYADAATTFSVRIPFRHTFFWSLF